MSRLRPILPELCAVLIPFCLLAWLNDRPDSNLLRWILAAGILLATLYFFWMHRDRFWRPVFTGALAAVALTLVLITSPDIHHPSFERFFVAGAVWYFLACCGWAWIRLLPRTRAKYQAPGVLIAGSVFTAALFVASAAWWLTAVDLYYLRKIPFVTTGPELQAQRHAPPGTRHAGIFTAGWIGDPAKRRRSTAAAGDFLAWVDSTRPGSILSATGDTRLPTSYEMTLTDGTRIDVRGIQSARETANWPAGGPRPWQRCLRDGDPVVIWADPGESRHMSTGAASSTLTATRMIAYGSPDEFKNGTLATILKTARVCGWVGFALIPLSFVPLILAIRRRRWLLRHGSDDPPPPGTKSLHQQWREQRGKRQ